MCPETYENVLRRFSVSLCVNFHQNLFINRMSRSVRQKSRSQCSWRREYVASFYLHCDDHVSLKLFRGIELDIELIIYQAIYWSWEPKQRNEFHR